ncbi:MAG TPA: sulfatase [Methylomirabilota bacterium]|nr:sulfatase [Methylomirabilota bacterium]
MKPVALRLLGLAVLVGLGTACAGSPSPEPAEARNLLILSIDTLRPDHLGCYGYHRDTSPELDRFAERSAVFEQAVTVHVSTAPAHATILTGRYPGSHGLVRNGMAVAPGVPTLAETLTAAGWATGAFVSGWTLQRHTGLDRGFEVYDDELGPPRAGARRDGGATTDAALRWLRDAVDGGRRFFLFLHLFEPHWPYDPPVGDALRFLPGRYELTTLSRPVHIDRRLSVNRLSPAERDEYVARYDGEIVVADRLVRRVLDALEELDLARSTVVVVLSDHGETLFEREWAMDHGARPYDEQARVPLVLHLPGDRLAGRRVPDQVSLVDIVPTVADIFALAPPEGVQGRSLLPLAEDPEGERPVLPAFVTARPEPSRVPHIRQPLTTSGLVCAIRMPGVKLVEFPMTRSRWHPELFDLAADPGETDNLAQARFDAALALHGQLEAWRIATASGGDVELPVLDPEVEEALRELGYLE